MVVRRRLTAMECDFVLDEVHNAMHGLLEVAASHLEARLFDIEEGQVNRFSITLPPRLDITIAPFEDVRK